MPAASVLKPLVLHIPCWLQFGLQFTVVQRRPTRIGQVRWSSVNPLERIGPKLLNAVGVSQDRARCVR